MQRPAAIAILTLSTLASTLAGAEPHEVDARYTAAIQKAAAAYGKWGRVDERPRLAPTLCAAVAPEQAAPSPPQLSQAEAGPHAHKLYYLWASDRSGYRALGTEHEQTLPVGFSIVKQSFSVKRGANDQLVPDRPRDLFVMTKVAASAIDGSDDGWVYGTVAPDGSVTSAGRVGRCMGCHDDATHERLFGLRGRQ